MGLTAQHPVISKLSESPGHISLLGISGSPNRLLLNECNSPRQRGQERHYEQTEQGWEGLGPRDTLEGSLLAMILSASCTP